MARLTYVPFLVLLLAAGGEAQTITTVAGRTMGFCGDGGAATSACLNFPFGVAVDTAGNLFIADSANNRIRKVDAAGTITTVTGGSCCDLGDGGPATSAFLLGPLGVAVDAAGSLFIADTNHHRIRKVDGTGIITTVAGSGLSGTYCGDGGPATGACLNGPGSVAVDAAGSLFIADTYNHRIRKVDAAGTITTVAGGSVAGGFCGDGGPATSACLSQPYGVAVDTAGNVFIVDSGNMRIRKVDGTGVITTVAGSRLGAEYCGDGGPATSACLGGPKSVAVDAVGSLFIADSGNKRIRKVDGIGVITTVAGDATGVPFPPPMFCGDGGPATSACLSGPTGVAVDAAGNLFIADYYNQRIRKVAAPDHLASLRLSKTLLSGCLKASGKVTLTEPAPMGGLVVALHSDNPHAVVPASLAFKAGVLSKTFSIATTAVAANEPVVIEASVPGQVLSATLTLKPMVPKSVSLTPNPVVGGTDVSGAVTLQCPAGPGDILVTLSSTKPLAAAPTEPSITVPVGIKVMPFNVSTSAVVVVTKPAIKAKANGVTKSKALVVNPAP